MQEESCATARDAIDTSELASRRRICSSLFLRSARAPTCSLPTPQYEHHTCCKRDRHCNKYHLTSTHVHSSCPLSFTRANHILHPNTSHTHHYETPPTHTMSGRRLRTRTSLTNTASSPASTRPRRSTVNQNQPATIERSSPDESRATSIRLTVKADPRKLKEATSGAAPPKRQAAVNARDAFVSDEIVVGGPRTTRKKAIVEESSEEDEDEEDEVEEEEEEEDAEGEEEEEEEDAEGEEDEEMAGEEEEDDEEEDEDEDEEDEEEEDAEADEDESMEDAPPVVPKGRAVPKPPQVKVTIGEPLMSVEDKEMAMDDDDDEELSELDDDEDLEGAEDELGLGGADDDDLDSDEDISRSATPDPSKLTRRQRAEPGELMALSNGTSAKLTPLSLQSDH